MGIFDFLFGGTESSIERHSKKVVNLNAQIEERNASAEWLAENGSPEAIAALLKRFSIRYEHAMKDTEEKLFIYAQLRSIGPNVVGPTKSWIEKNSNFAQPLKLIEEFEGKEATIQFLLDVLDKENDPFKPEKKRQILIKLASFKEPRIAERIIKCLHDIDDEVRLATVEALDVQDLTPQNEPEIRRNLEEVLSNPEEESNRFRVRIVEMYIKRGWNIDSPEDYLIENPPSGFSLVDGKFVAQK